MRPRGKAVFRQSNRHTYRLELQLDFDGAVSALRAKEVARRLTEALRLSVVEARDLAGLQRCQLVCHELRQVLPLDLEAH